MFSAQRVTLIIFCIVSPSIAGFGIVGGASTGVVIKTVLPGSPAAKVSKVFALWGMKQIIVSVLDESNFYLKKKLCLYWLQDENVSLCGAN